MNLDKEKERIKQYFDQMTEKQFQDMLIECGLGVIKPTEEIRKFYYPNLYEEKSKYNVKTSYKFSKEMIMDEDYIFAKGVA